MCNGCYDSIRRINGSCRGWQKSWLGCLVLLYSVSAQGGDFYRCHGEQGAALVYPADSCRLLSDPTQPMAPAAVTPPVAPPTPSVAAVAPVQPASIRSGPWQLSQILWVENTQGGHWQAVINHRTVTTGTQIDGGRVKEITRSHVTITHPGGESHLTPGQTTQADGRNRPGTISLTLEELGLDSSASRLLLLQRIAAGQELLIMHNGIPLARLDPISTHER
ncbi:MAG: hypothetical protein HQM04_10190 [Magnetococcales bacterium]|nr:hypothetical protein [Magnetococcales bacterium]MBF0115400.1 hypothetical protein [Magnetococcales bacterium]